MREYIATLRTQGALVGAGVVAGSVLVITALAFFRVTLLPAFGAELRMTTVQLGAVTTVFAVGRLIADLPGGHLADRIGALTLMAVSSFGVAASSLLFGLAPVAALVFVAAFVLGVSSSVTNATGMTYFSILGGAATRGTAMAVFSAGLLGGQALGPTAAGILASVWGWRTAMVAASVAAAVVGVALLRRPRRHVTGEERGEPAAARPEAAPARPRLRHMVVLQSVSFAMFFTLGSIPQTLIPVIGASELGLGSAAIGIALGIGGATRLVGTLIGGRLADRVSRKAALVPGLVVQALGVALLALPHSVVSWLAAIVLMSLASFAISVAGTVLGDLTSRERVGRQMGRFRFVGDLGLIAGPLVVAWLYDAVDPVVAIGSVVALLLGVATLCRVLLPETHPAGRAR